MTVQFTGRIRRLHEDKPGGLAFGDEVPLAIDRAAVPGA